MRKQTTTFFTMAALLTFAITSCQKDSATSTTFTATVEDCQEQDGKTSLEGSSMLWDNGDQIKVFGTGSGVYQASVHGTDRTTFSLVSGDAGSGPYRAVYPASAANDDGTIELPVVQVTTDGSLTGFPMYAENNCTALDFKNLCGALRLRLKKNGVNITAIEITGDTELTGDFNVNFNNGSPTLSYADHGTKTTMMTCSTPQSITNQKDFYIFLPAHNYQSMRIRIYSSDGGVCTKTLNANYSVNIQRSMITTITLTSTNSLTFTSNAGALPGLFTIDDQGHQVRFSQGNLQYTTLGTHAGALGNNMPGTWRFALEQYETVGWDNDNISSTFPRWIDIFGWGTGANPTLNSDNGDDYSTFVEWGNNAIYNGGNIPNMWRTLSCDEWNFILGRLENNGNVLYGTGNIEGIPGLFILPDNWTLPEECSFNPGGAPDVFYEDEGEGYWSYDWTHNSYTYAQWRRMEENGAIFLQKIYHNSNSGYYWTSNRGQVLIYFPGGSIFTSGLNDGDGRDHIYVRLVQNNY